MKRALYACLVILALRVELLQIYLGLLNANGEDPNSICGAVAFIDRLPEKAVSETAPIIQILNDAITGLRRSNIPGSEKYNWYFGLLKLTVKYQPADANAVLKDAIASLNQVKEATPLYANEAFRNIGAPLLEMDEFIVKDALASVILVQPRTQLRLALLAATLQRLGNASRN